MTDTSLFFSTRPAFPWSVYPVGLPALAVVAALLVVLTVWTYLGHPQATRKRVLIVLALRLAALAVTLLTAIRPSAGFQEEPKVPSVLLIGIDLSESMTVKDEVNNQSRIDAVRRVLEKCQPTLDELASEQNVNVVFYRFGPPDFSPDTARYDPKDPADAKRSDYGTYLKLTHDRWMGERFVRGHILIGDGADNGTATSAVAEAARWGRRNVPITTFTVGSENIQSDAQDIQVPKSFWRWIFSGEWRKGPPIVSLLMRAATVTTGRDLAASREATDVLILPNVDKIEIRDWKAYDAAVEAGRIAALEVLDRLKKPVTALRRRPSIDEASAAVIAAQ